MSYHPDENVKKLASFLGLNLSDEKISEVVKTCSFENMKKVDAEFKEEFPGRRTEDGESAIFRKGKYAWIKYTFHARSNYYALSFTFL